MGRHRPAASAKRSECEMSNVIACEQCGCVYKRNWGYSECPHTPFGFDKIEDVPAHLRLKPGFPEKWNCNGIVYRTLHAEGAIIFSVAEPGWGCESRVMWSRPGDCWHVSLEAVKFGPSIMFSHLLSQWELIEAYYGGNFTHKRQIEKPDRGVPPESGGC